MSLTDIFGIPFSRNEKPLRPMMFIYVRDYTSAIVLAALLGFVAGVALVLSRLS